MPAQNVRETMRPVSSSTLDQARFIYDTIQVIRSRIIERHIAAARSDSPDLTIPQMNTLRMIKKQASTSIKDLAGALGVSAPSASVMVERLVEMALVSREQSHSDRREVVITLTHDGLSVVNRMECVLLGAFSELLERIGAEYAQKWCEVYERIQQVLMEEDSAVATQNRVVNEGEQ